MTIALASLLWLGAPAPVAPSALSASARGSGAQGASDQARRFDRLGHKMICKCGCNQILLACNHVGCPLSSRMRAELETALTRGDSDDLVLQAFVQQYGPAVLAAPTASGFNRVAWIMPFAVLLAGFAAAVTVARHWRRRLRQAPSLDSVTGSPPAGLESFRRRARRETEL